MRLASILLVGCGPSASKSSPAAVQTQQVTIEDSRDASSHQPAPLDKVVSMSDEMEAAIRPFVDDAKSSYPDVRERYQAGLERGQQFMIVTRLFDTTGQMEQVFVRVVAIQAGVIRGSIANEVSLPGYAMGDSIEVAESDLLDWVIVRPDGSEEGNRVGKFLDYWHSGEFFGALFGIRIINPDEVSIRFVRMMDRHKNGAAANFAPPSVFLEAAFDNLKHRSWEKVPAGEEVFTYMLYWPLEPTNVEREP